VCSPVVDAFESVASCDGVMCVLIHYLNNNRAQEYSF